MFIIESSDQFFLGGMYAAEPRHLKTIPSICEQFVS